MSVFCILCSKKIFVLILINSLNSKGEKALFYESAPPWYMHFEQNTGTHSSGVSTNFIPTPESGMASVRVGTGGSFILQNPGLGNFGVGSELVSKASSDGTPAKFSISNYTPGKSFYLKYTVRWDGASSGEWYCLVGDGGSFSNNSIFVDNEVFSGFRITYVTGGNLNIGVREGTTWTSLPGLTVGIKQNTSYTIEIFGNNSTSSINYSYGSNLMGCTNQNIPSNTMDVFVNGFRAGNDLAKGGLPDNSDIDSYMFYGINSPGNLATYYLDDIVYSNTIAASISEPKFQPSTLLFSDTTSASYKLSFNPAHGAPTGYIILRKAGSYPESTPQDFVSYNSGSAIGDAQVAYIGPNLSINETALTSGTEYYYRIYSFIGTGNCRNYVLQQPLEGTLSTFFNEDLATVRSRKTGGWRSPDSWDYEYLPGKYKGASKIPTKANKSITIRQNHIINSSSIETRKLILEARSSLIVDGDITVADGPDEFDLINVGSIQINGNLKLVGKMENKPGSKVEFMGAGSQNIPSGIYYGLGASTGGEKIFSGDVEIKEFVELKNASINTAGYALTLDSTAILKGENNENYVRGKIKITKTISVKKEDFNGIGLKIDPTINKENLGKVAVVRSTGTPTFVGTSSSISRNWSIEPEFQPAKSVEVTFNWLAADEHIPFDLKYMRIWKSTDKGITWKGIEDYQAAYDRSITVTTTSFSDWTASDFNNILPLNHKELAGKETPDGSSVLFWGLNPGMDNSGEVEKSLDGKTFYKIGVLKALENKNAKADPVFKDNNFAAGAYYRIKYQKDYIISFSNIVYISKTVNSSRKVKFFPNPFNDQTTPKISISQPGKEDIEVALYSAQGNEIMRLKESIDAINKYLSLISKDWKEGFYILEVKVNGKVEKIKIYKSK